MPKYYNYWNLEKLDAIKPEGPEIWIISEAINKFYHYEKTRAYGNCLFFMDKGIQEGVYWYITFGLSGKMCIDDNNKLYSTSGSNGIKRNPFFNYDEEIKKHGIDWLTSSESDLRKEVDSWITSKKQLGWLMSDQSKISGIGAAWGSEILYKAGLKPNTKARRQNLSNLVDVMIEVREKIKILYNEHLDESTCKNFINNSFENLYEIREMDIYKKGTKVEISGRYWWV